MLKEPPARKGVLDYQPYVKLRGALPEHLKTVAVMGYYTGMRLEEILSIRPEQTDFTEDEIRLNAGETKNDDARVIPPGGLSELKESLKWQLD